MGNVVTKKATYGAFKVGNEKKNWKKKGLVSFFRLDRPVGNITGDKQQKIFCSIYARPPPREITTWNWDDIISSPRKTQCA